MNESKSASLLGESIITAISIGFFLLLLGILFIITPNLFGEIIDLLGDFELVEVVSNSDLIFLGPASAHTVVYIAAAQFSLALGLFQIVVLALRFLASSQWGKKAETVGNLVFWLGTWFLIQSFLLETPRPQWFVFWSTVIILIGVSLIARAGVMAVSRIT